MTSPAPTWRRYLAIALGTGLGGLLRFQLSLFATSAVTTQALTFSPLAVWPTLVANVIGAAAIGWLSHTARRHPEGWVARWQAFLITGLCGGFTTFSLFSLEILLLWQGGGVGWALGYLLINLAGWPCAVRLGQRVAGRRREMASLTKKKDAA